MNETVEYDVQHAEDFFKVGRQGVKARADDREKGASIFLRLDDGARVDLIARILDNWLDEEDLNLAMVSGALRVRNNRTVGERAINFLISSACMQQVCSLLKSAFHSV